MSHIYFISPSGAVVDKAGLRRAIRRLEKAGHTIELDPSIVARHQRFAGTDQERLQAFSRAAHSRADAVMITRGGYGMSRLLPDLPYGLIKRSIERGTQWMGFSDFTAFALALYSQTSAVSWAGPAVIESFGAQEEVHPITQGYFEDWLAGVHQGAGWRCPKEKSDSFHARDLTLWGGNLTMVASLVGTPYLADIQKGALFLEDVGESAYRLERLLTQLWLSGILKKQKIIFLGQFTEIKKGPIDKQYGWPQVVEWLRAHTSAKIVTAMPFGHTPGRLILPVGAQVEVLVENQECLILW